MSEIKTTLPEGYQAWCVVCNETMKVGQQVVCLKEFRVSPPKPGHTELALQKPPSNPWAHTTCFGKFCQSYGPLTNVKDVRAFIAEAMGAIENKDSAEPVITPMREPGSSGPSGYFAHVDKERSVFVDSYTREIFQGEVIRREGAFASFLRVESQYVANTWEKVRGKKNIPLSPAPNSDLLVVAKAFVESEKKHPVKELKRFLARKPLPSEKYHFRDAIKALKRKEDESTTGVHG